MRQVGQPALAQMQPGADRRRQPPIAGHRQHQPAAAAQPGQVTRQLASPRRAVMAQHHTGQPARQRRHRRTRIRQP